MTSRSILHQHATAAPRPTRRQTVGTLAVLVVLAVVAVALGESVGAAVGLGAAVAALLK